MILIKIAGVLLFSYLLGKITDRLIKTFNLLSKTFLIGKFEITAIIMALFTSLPEIMVAITSSVGNSNKLALGNTTGANIVNLSLVIGMTAVVGRVLHFNSDEYLKNNLGPLVYSLIPFLLISDGAINRVDGIILIILYGLYAHNLMVKRKGSNNRGLAMESSGKVSKLMLVSLGQVAAMLVCAQIIVMLAKGAAVDLKIPLVFVGLFLVSIGTTLPEIVFNIKAAKKREISMSLGNVIGSCVTNATLVIGLAALIRPIEIGNIYQVLTIGVEYALIMSLLVYFVYTKHRLETWEGIILIVLFTYYMGLALLFK